MDPGVILFAEIGATRETARIQISGDAARDVAQAVRFEHPCDDSTCNITASLRAGFPFVAAWILRRARKTRILQRSAKTPLLDAVMAEYDMNPGSPEGLEEWEAHAATVSLRCDGCGAYTYDESRDWFHGRSCENCGSRLRAPRHVA
ncbi:MAG TPA: hypothetical protein VEQ37_08035 [Actinomycetota bacterium]|nr:hypothetical protein [Actinomycetota bacterium]